MEPDLEFQRLIEANGADLMNWSFEDIDLLINVAMQVQFREASRMFSEMQGDSDDGL